MLTQLSGELASELANGLTIRRATPDDAAALTELAARTFYDAFFETNTPENMQAYMSEAFTPERILSEVTDSNAKVLVVEFDDNSSENRLIGYAKLYEGDAPDCIASSPTIEIKRFYLDRRFHGAGVAHSLMQACLDEAKQAAAQTIFLGVWEHNPRAQAFYRKWGFEIAGSHPFQMGDELQTDLWMQRKV